MGMEWEVEMTSLKPADAGFRAAALSIMSFRELRVWQIAMDVAEQIYRLTDAFPREASDGLATELRAAAVTIPCYIAEGHACDSRKEYQRYIAAAQKTLCELETRLEIASRLRVSPATQLDRIQRAAGHLGRQLSAIREDV